MLTTLRNNHVASRLKALSPIHQPRSTDAIIDEITEEDPTYPVLLIIGTALPNPDKFPGTDAIDHRGVRFNGKEVAVYRPRLWERTADGDITLHYSSPDESEYTIDAAHITRFIPVHPLS